MRIYSRKTKSLLQFLELNSIIQRTQKGIKLTETQTAITRSSLG
jgi:hypothetical protein